MTSVSNNSTSELQALTSKLKSFDLSGFEQLFNGQGFSLNSIFSNNTFKTIAQEAGLSSQTTNSLFNIVGQAETAISGNDEQKAKALLGVVESIFDIASGLGLGEQAKANKDVRKNDKTIQDLENNALKLSEKNKEQINALLEKVADNTTTISNALEEIEKLGGDKGVIAKAQEKLNKQVKIIEDNQKIINDDNSTPKKRNAALKNIKDASAAINGLLQNIISYQEQIYKNQETVAEATDGISENITNLTQTITDGAEELNQYIQQGSQLAVVNTTEIGNGGEYTAVGTAQEAAGQAMQSNFVTAAEGAKFIAAGNDKIGAGKTRIQGSVSNLGKLSEAIGRMGSDLSQLSDFAGSVGKLTGNRTDLVGQYTAALEPTITALGSWEQVANANAQLENAISNYESVDNSGDVEQTITENDSEDEEPSANEGKKLDFDINLFKQAFEA